MYVYIAIKTMYYKEGPESILTCRHGYIKFKRVYDRRKKTFIGIQNDFAYK
jgi:hypothetical protein